MFTPPEIFRTIFYVVSESGVGPDMLVEPRLAGVPVSASPHLVLFGETQQLGVAHGRAEAVLA